MIKPIDYRCEHRHNGLSHRNCYLNHVELVEDGRVGFLDIETSQLNAQFGFMISWSIKQRHGDTVYDYITKKDFKHEYFDKRITSSLLKELSNYDIIYTYYGARFDIPFIRSLALKHKLNFPIQNQIIHRDLYFIVRNKLRLNSNRLENVTRYLGISGKTELKGDVWRRAAYGHRKSIQYILRHNMADVEILEKLFDRLKPYMGRTRTSI